MSKELSRRNFLERIGLGTAAGASLSLLKDVAAATPRMVDPLPSRTLGRTGAKVSILFLRMRQPLPHVPGRR